MKTVCGTLLYKKDVHTPWQIRVDNHTFDLWKKVESKFWALAGHRVIREDGVLSFSLTLDAETDWVFYHESREEMILKNVITRKCFNVADHLDRLFNLLDGRTVQVEADNEHFKIFAAETETQQ